MKSNIMSVKEWREASKKKKAAALTPKARVQEPYKDRSKYAILIGIDPGVDTGMCIYRDGEIQILQTLAIHKAIDWVNEWVECYGKSVFVRFEDARLRTWFGNTGKERMKGAGSVERDCSIWQAFLDDLGVDYDRVHPKDVKETTAEHFKTMTGWDGRTSKHAREAAWMVI